MLTEFNRLSSRIDLLTNRPLAIGNVPSLVSLLTMTAAAVIAADVQLVVVFVA
jgi:hypothetical protein